MSNAVYFYDHRKWINLSFLRISILGQQAINSKNNRESSEVIIEELQDEFLKTPNTASKWLEISDKLSQQWKFPNAIGAIDGKHIVLEQPKSLGSHHHS